MFTSTIPANTNQVKNLLSTGILSGCFITTSDVQATTADVTISVGVARFVDNHTNPLLPNFKGDFNIATQTLQNVNVSLGAKIILNEDLTITSEVFTATDSASQRRTRIELAIIGAGGQVLRAYSNLAFDTSNLLKDTMEAVGIVKMSGFDMSANGTNLSLSIAEGNEYSQFFGNYDAPSNLDPLNEIIAAKSLVSFFETWQDSSVPGGFNLRFSRTTLNPSVYDDGDSSGSVPDGIVQTNSAQIMRVYESSGSVGVLYGQTKYNSIAAALDALLHEQFVQSPFFINTSLRGFIIIRGGATDLSDPSDALIFQPVSPFIGVRA